MLSFKLLPVARPNATPIYVVTNQYLKNEIKNVPHFTIMSRDFDTNANASTLEVIYVKELPSKKSP